MKSEEDFTERSWVACGSNLSWTRVVRLQVAINSVLLSQQKTLPQRIEREREREERREEKDRERERDDKGKGSGFSSTLG